MYIGARAFSRRGNELPRKVKEQKTIERNRYTRGIRYAALLVLSITRRFPANFLEEFTASSKGEESWMIIIIIFFFVAAVSALVTFSSFFMRRDRRMYMRDR